MLVAGLLRPQPLRPLQSGPNQPMGYTVWMHACLLLGRHGKRSHDQLRAMFAKASYCWDSAGRASRSQKSHRCKNTRRLRSTCNSVRQRVTRADAQYKVKCRMGGEFNPAPGRGTAPQAPAHAPSGPHSPTQPISLTCLLALASASAYFVLDGTLTGNRHCLE